jgi:hypothetical protein
MGATNTLNKTSKNFIKRLSGDYPEFNFKAGNQEHWSPRSRTVTFNPDQPLEDLRCGLLHELAHALLGHSTYQSDFELLKLESQAWELAVEVAKKYAVEIDEDHIQNCLDTYRDWLHRRSTCPTCGTHVLQKNSENYQCFNCLTTWQVSSGKFMRPYRKMRKTKSSR